MSQWAEATYFQVCLSDSSPNVSFPDSLMSSVSGKAGFPFCPSLYPWAEYQALHIVDAQQRLVQWMKSGVKEHVNLLPIFARFGREGKADLGTALPKILCPWCVPCQTRTKKKKEEEKEVGRRELPPSIWSCPSGGTNWAEWSLGEAARVQCGVESWWGRGELCVSVGWGTGDGGSVSGRGASRERQWKLPGRRSQTYSLGRSALAVVGLLLALAGSSWPHLSASPLPSWALFCSNQT